VEIELLKHAASLNALEQLAAGLVVTDHTSRIVYLNEPAERIVQREDGLIIRCGRLTAQRAFESAKLSSFIGAAAPRSDPAAARRRLLIGRRERHLPYVVTVASLGTELFPGGRQLTMVLIVDREMQAPSMSDFADLFGMSPAESRLAASLLAGQTLREIATQLGVQITTLRTQLGFIMRKVGVRRQADLVRVLASL
jgi:DNA-binding CsgD family transcriptional regulator